MTQVVECLPGKHEALNSPSTSKRKEKQMRIKGKIKGDK
jgi:hypothetical protein